MPYSLAQESARKSTSDCPLKGGTTLVNYLQWEISSALSSSVEGALPTDLGIQPPCTLIM